MGPFRGGWDPSALSGGAFDVVPYSEVLVHIRGHEATAAELILVLKPEGNLVVSVPKQLPERIYWALSDEHRHEEGGHIRIYTKKELLDLLGSFGLKPWDAHCAHTHSHPCRHSRQAKPSADRDLMF